MDNKKLSLILRIIGENIMTEFKFVCREKELNFAKEALFKHNFTIYYYCLCQPKIRSIAHWKLGHFRPSLAPAALLPQVQLLFYYCFEIGSIATKCFSKSVGIAFHINQISLVCEPINDCTCYGCISKYFIPSLKCKIWSNNGWFLGCPQGKYCE